MKIRKYFGLSEIKKLHIKICEMQPKQFLEENL